MNDTLKLYVEAIRRIEEAVDDYRVRYNEPSNVMQARRSLDSIEGTLYELTEILSHRSEMALNIDIIEGDQYA
jgi:hypothetical protein